MAEEIGTADSSQQYPPEPKGPSDPAISLPVELWRSILLMQLTECWNDTRNIDNLVWQIPAGIGAILGLIISGIGVRALSGQPDLLDVGAMCAVLFVSSSLVLALYKNRMFQVSRSIYMKDMYRQLLATSGAQAGTLVPVGLNADDCSMDELPGFVPRVTRELSAGLPVLAAKSLPRFGPLNKIVRNASAYKVMFRASVSVLVAEFILMIWLLVRFALKA